MTVAFGLIGCGRISEKHVRSLTQLDSARLVAVSDVDPEKMEQMEKLHQQLCGRTLTKLKDYRQLLGLSGIDAVIITTVSGLHAEMAKEALKAGKHVIVEKPMALSLQDADEIIRLGEENNLEVLVCHQLRYHPLMRKVKRVVEKGALGRIVYGTASVRLQRSENYFRTAPWRGSWELDGGMLLNQGIHLIDLMIWFLGDVQTAYGELAKGSMNKETEDAALGILHFQNGAKLMVEVTTLTHPNNMGNAMTLFGEQGTIAIGGHRLEQIIRWSVSDPAENDLSMEDLEKNERVLMYHDFIQTLTLGKGKVLMNSREGRKALEAIFALYSSFLRQSRITLPLKDFSTAQMRGAAQFYPNQGAGRGKNL